MLGNGKNEGSNRFDVVVTGGGILGSAIAYFLACNPDFKGSIAVFDKDLSYQNCSTTRSVGSIRQQFSTLLNVQISQFGWKFIASANQYLRTSNHEPDISLVPASYLILSDTAGLFQLTENHKVQLEAGAQIELLKKDELSRNFPWLNAVDLAAGTRGLEKEGWFDPYSLLIALQKKAVSLGVVYFNEKVELVEASASKVTGVTTKSGRKFFCEAFVNAGGPYAGELAQLAGIHLPVVPRVRFVFVFNCRETIRNMPMVVDPTGMYVRPEGNHYICGISPSSENDPDSYSLEVDHSVFDNIIWPILAHRIPVFESVRVVNSWAGHYDFNKFDQNGIVGAHPTISNYYFANGFSGHGLQQAPAIGRGISELIAYNEYRTLNLDSFGYERIIGEQTNREQIII